MNTSMPPAPRPIAIAPATQPPRILAVFAHPDDESFCAGGTLATYAAAGAEVMVVSATRGDAGQIHDPSVATRHTLGQVRARELDLACERLGIRSAICLDYGDGTLHQVEPEALTRHITRIVREFQPDVVITFGPDGAYGHPDHIAIGAATTTACDLAGDPAAFPEQIAAGLAPHAPEATFHSAFPRRRTLLRDHLARWLSTQEQRFQGAPDFTRALLLLAREASILGLAADHVEVQWYPAGFAIVEQGEPATRLYLILSGAAEVVREDDAGTRHVVERLEAGMFFGEEDLARGQLSTAHVVALESMTCLVFAPGEPTAFAGRGTTANPTLETTPPETEVLARDVTTAVDVSAVVERKVAAIAAHRSQCPIAPNMFPVSLLRELMGREYFVRVAPAPVLETELLPRRALAPVTRLPERRPWVAAA